MASIKKMIAGKECECIEVGSTGLMRLHLEGTFSGDITRESLILVPLTLPEAVLDDISDRWLTQQEKELGLPVGESCSSNSWWAGSSDPSKDHLLTHKYDSLIYDSMKRSSTKAYEDATYISEWDIGTRLEFPCKVDLATKEVFDIALDSKVLDDFEHLQGEYVRLADGSQFELYGKFHLSTINSEVFWYEDDASLVLLRDATKNMDNFFILSVENCHDEDYGQSIVQFGNKVGFISFAFTSLDANTVLSQPDLALAEIVNDRNLLFAPSWSELSAEMLSLIRESGFDMYFVEFGDHEWTEDMADKIWEESVAHGLNSVVTAGEDGALITVYAGAMGSVNWNNHPQYGKPCLEHVVEDLKHRPKKTLGDKIQDAQTRKDASATGSFKDSYPVR